MELPARVKSTSCSICYSIWEISSKYFCPDFWILSNRKQVDFKKAIKRVVNIWKQVMIYSLLCGGAFLFFKECINVGKLLKMVFPILTGHWWFMTTYIGLMILEPFLSQFANSLN